MNHFYVTGHGTYIKTLVITDFLSVCAVTVVALEQSCFRSTLTMALMTHLLLLFAAAIPFVAAGPSGCNNDEFW